ncbi:hypothetical protein GJ688_12840 [Heliobacillus mobilis]|uniref:Uncharacterized protein n=1 Tax=Heliobacterium mobile TaxID=28064 RepID=A0A6I3SLU2_HELMO|nr:hypothetical protein [Heliobacterium mobile]MTV49859.1 hypothetical protein [Heliobacterium mobile]
MTFRELADEGNEIRHIADGLSHEQLHQYISEWANLCLLQLRKKQPKSAFTIYFDEALRNTKVLNIRKLETLLVIIHGMALAEQYSKQIERHAFLTSVVVGSLSI